MEALKEHLNEIGTVLLRCTRFHFKFPRYYQLLTNVSKIYTYSLINYLEKALNLSSKADILQWKKIISESISYLFFERALEISKVTEEKPC